jgi:drug/metabolite transporter (DMT)-like permease
MSLSNTQKGILYAFLGFNSFTLVDGCTKWLGDSYAVSTVLFWVYLIALITTVLVAVPTGLKKSLRTRTPFIHIARSLLLLILAGCAVTAFSKGLPLSTLYTIVFLSPALSTLAARALYKEQISKGSWQVILLGFAGIIVAFYKDISLLSPGILYAFGVLGASITINILARPIDRRDSVLTLPFYPALILPLAILVYTRGSIPLPSLVDVPVFAFGGIMLFFAMIGVIQCFRIAPYAKVAPMQYTQMLSGIVVGYFVFNDMPGIWMLLGAGMIITSGLLLIMQKK